MALRHIDEFDLKFRSYVRKRGDVFEIHTRNGILPYELPLAELRTESELIGWMFHLAEKSWCTRTKLRQLVLAAYRHWGKKVPH